MFVTSFLIWETCLVSGISSFFSFSNLFEPKRQHIGLRMRSCVWIVGKASMASKGARFFDVEGRGSLPRLWGGAAAQLKAGINLVAALSVLFLLAHNIQSSSVAAAPGWYRFTTRENETDIDSLAPEGAKVSTRLLNLQQCVVTVWTM